MTKIKIEYTYDESECEECGYDYAKAFLVTVGDKVYGGKAVARCCGGYSNHLGDVLTEVLRDNGFIVEHVDH